MPSLMVGLNITADDYLAWYTGEAKYVHAKTTDGRTVQFPARILQRFVTPHGIKGVFVLFFDQSNRFTRIERYSPVSHGGRIV